MRQEQKVSVSYLLFQITQYTTFYDTNSRTKTLEIRPNMFRASRNHIPVGNCRISLVYLRGMFIYICYKGCRYVTMSIHSIRVRELLPGRDYTIVIAYSRPVSYPHT